MKLRNKATGEIGCISSFNAERIVIWGNNNSDKPGDDNYYKYNSLAELNEEWEDYEEPANFWYIDDYDIMLGSVGEDMNLEYSIYTKEQVEKLKAIGNYFKTEEEAEKAVEKLKAWKRLEDKGFKFTDWNCPCRELEFVVDEEKFFKPSGEINEETRADLDLLLGGEE